MVAKKTYHYHKLAEAHKTISEGYKKLANATENGIEYTHIHKTKTAGFKKR